MTLAKKRFINKLDKKRTWRQRIKTSRSCYSAHQLRNYVQNEANKPDTSYQEERKGDARVKQPAGDTIKQPRRGQETKAHARCDVCSRSKTRTLCVSHLNPAEADKEEEDGG